MTREFCDICGRPIETYEKVSEFKLKKAVFSFRESWWQRLTFTMLAGENFASKLQI